VAGERLRGNLPVVKGEHGAPNILAALMALARYHQYISLVCHRHGQIDGRSSIGLYDDPCPLAFRDGEHSVDHFREYRQRIL